MLVCFVMDKSTLRNTLLVKRRALAESDIDRMSTSCCEKLKIRPDCKAAKFIVAYSSFDNEVRLEDWISWALSVGKRIALPCFRNGEYGVAWIKSLEDLEEGKYGIFEPNSRCPLLSHSERSRVELWLVPGVGFTKEGRRVGYGGGIYDRLLQGVAGKALGIAYPFQILNFLPRDHHDILMHEVVNCI